MFWSFTCLFKAKYTDVIIAFNNTLRICLPPLMHKKMTIRLRLSLHLFIRQTQKNISLHIVACPSLNPLFNPMKLNVLTLVICKISCKMLYTGLLAPHISVLRCVIPVVCRINQTVRCMRISSDTTVY